MKQLRVLAENPADYKADNEKLAWLVEARVVTKPNRPYLTGRTTYLAKRSRSSDHRRGWRRLTAMASALREPTSTKSFLARVTAV